jgi:hypothetical protein
MTTVGVFVIRLSLKALKPVAKAFIVAGRFAIRADEQGEAIERSSRTERADA